MKALVVLMVLNFACAAFAQETETRTPPRNVNINQTFLGSVSQGTATGATIPLSIADAIDRALKYNLGTILSDQETRVARAARLRTLSELLPKVNANVTETVQQINLAAFGFTNFPGVRLSCGTFQCFRCACALYTDPGRFQAFARVQICC